MKHAENVALTTIAAEIPRIAIEPAPPVLQARRTT